MVPQRPGPGQRRRGWTGGAVRIGSVVIDVHFAEEPPVQGDRGPHPCSDAVGRLLLQIAVPAHLPEILAGLWAPRHHPPCPRTPHDPHQRTPPGRSGQSGDATRRSAKIIGTATRASSTHHHANRWPAERSRGSQRTHDSSRTPLQFRKFQYPGLPVFICAFFSGGPARRNRLRVGTGRYFADAPTLR
jgi:hypothetical protein